MANRYKFATTLSGFISVAEDSGKFNNRTFAYTIPSDVLAKVEADREELLKWAKSKSTGRVQAAMEPWDEEGTCKYTYGAGDGSRKGKKVNIIVDQKPYSMGPNIGTTMRVVGVQIVELVSGNGSVDSGDLSVEDVAAMFGSVDGFKADSPAVRDARPAETTEDSYDF